MKQEAPPIAPQKVQQLLTAAQEASPLAQALTGMWPILLQQRLNWLDQWDATLAPILTTPDTPTAEFPLKPQQVTDLLRAWGHGMPADVQKAPSNSAALMLMGFANHPQLLNAARQWAQALQGEQSAAHAHDIIDQGHALVHWFCRWGRHAAELVLLETLQSVSALSPDDQKRLEQLGGERWKGQRMQVAADRPRVEPRDRSDAHSLERYFKTNPKASQTLLALRRKPVNAQNERLQVPNWNTDGFFNALQQGVQRQKIIASQYDLHRLSVTLGSTSADANCDAALFRHKDKPLTLLLTFNHIDEIADIKLATLVLAVDMTLDEYCQRVMQVNDEVESQDEGDARYAIINAVQAALEALKTAPRQSPDTMAG